jgi:hypothetical protein
MALKVTGRCISNNLLCRCHKCSLISSVDVELANTGTHLRRIRTARVYVRNARDFMKIRNVVVTFKLHQLLEERSASTRQKSSRACF